MTSFVSFCTSERRFEVRGTLLPFDNRNLVKRSLPGPGTLAACATVPGGWDGCHAGSPPSPVDSSRGGPPRRVGPRPIAILPNAHFKSYFVFDPGNSTRFCCAHPVSCSFETPQKAMQCSGTVLSNGDSGSLGHGAWGLRRLSRWFSPPPVDSSRGAPPSEPFYHLLTSRAILFFEPRNSTRFCCAHPVSCSFETPQKAMQCSSTVLSNGCLMTSFVSFCNSGRRFEVRGTLLPFDNRNRVKRSLPGPGTLAAWGTVPGGWDGCHAAILPNAHFKSYFVFEPGNSTRFCCAYPVSCSFETPQKAMQCSGTVLSNGCSMTSFVSFCTSERRFEVRGTLLPLDNRNL
eukprot:gene23862-biopygen20854